MEPVALRLFRPRVVPTVAALLGLALTASACVWQYGRGREKDRIQERIAAAAHSEPVALGSALLKPESILLRPVTVTGRFVPDTLVLQDNQTRAGQPGYHVYMALRIGDGPMHVLVKRGWIAGGVDRNVLPPVSTPTDSVRVDGLALQPNSRFVELSADTQTGVVWQNVTLERFTDHFRLELQPLILEQHSPLEDGLVRQWPQPASGSAKHYGYAFQWGAMATLIIILYVYFSFRRSPAPTPSA